MTHKLRAIRAAFVREAVARYNGEVERARRDLTETMRTITDPATHFWGNVEKPRGYSLRWGAK